MGSFVPTNVDTKREEEKVSEEFLNAPQPHNWNIGDEPLSEFDCQFFNGFSNFISRWKK